MVLNREQVFGDSENLEEASNDVALSESAQDLPDALDILGESSELPSAVVGANFSPTKSGKRSPEVVRRKNETEAARAARKRYRRSERGRVKDKHYQDSPEVREYKTRHERQRDTSEYDSSIRRRLSKQKYRGSPKGREAKRRELDKRRTGTRIRQNLMRGLCFCGKTRDECEEHREAMKLMDLEK